MIDAAAIPVCAATVDAAMVSAVAIAVTPMHADGPVRADAACMIYAGRADDGAGRFRKSDDRRQDDRRESDRL